MWLRCHFAISGMQLTPASIAYLMRVCHGSHLSIPFLGRKFGASGACAVHCSPRATIFWLICKYRGPLSRHSWPTRRWSQGHPSILLLHGFLVMIFRGKGCKSVVIRRGACQAIMSQVLIDCNVLGMTYCMKSKQQVHLPTGRNSSLS